MVEKFEITNEQENIIKEVGTVGAGNATIALSKLTGRDVKMKVTTAAITSPEEVSKMITTVEDTIFSAYAPILGIVSGGMMILTPGTSSYILIDMIEKLPVGTTKALDRMGESALEETQNIIGNAYLSALNNFIGVTLIPAVPRVSSIYKDDVDALIRNSINTITDHVLAISTDFSVENVNGVFILLIAMESLDPIIKAMKERIGGGIETLRKER